MPSSKRFSRLDQFVAQSLENPSEPEERAVLGSYIIIAEIIHPDQVELRVATSEGLAPWSALGMLSAATDVVGDPMPSFDILLEPEDGDGEPDTLD